MKSLVERFKRKPKPDPKRFPVPASAAGAGPFRVRGNQPGSFSGESAGPERNGPGSPGIFNAPLTDELAAVATRAHEYGHLELERRGAIDYPALSKGSAELGITSEWYNAALDIIVNSFMLAQGVDGIQHLQINRPDRGVNLPKEIVEQTWLRSRQLSTADMKFWNLRLNKALSESRTRAERICELSDAHRILTEYGKYSAQRGYKIPTDSLLELMQRLQTSAYGGEPDAKSDSPKPPDDGLKRMGIASITSDKIAKALSSKPESSSSSTPPPTLSGVRELLKKLGVSTSASLRRYDGDWGKMEEISLPLALPKAAKVGRNRYRPGFVGAFAYPHRALLPSGDGQAFRFLKKGQGGTVLIDCSGSMGLRAEHLAQILVHAPHAIVAGYGSKPYYEGYGILTIAAKRGRVTTSELLREAIGSGNIVDGPALEWLARQKPPRVWISDGLVTGVGDLGAPNLSVEAFAIAKSAGVIRFDTISTFLEAIKEDKG